MNGIQWAYDQKPTPKTYVGEKSNQWSDLLEILEGLETEFGLQPLKNEEKTTLTTDQTIFIVERLCGKIDDLLQSYNPAEKLGLNSVTDSYHGKSYQLYTHGSDKHLLTFWHIKLVEFLRTALDENITVTIGKGNKEITTYKKTKSQLKSGFSQTVAKSKEE